MPASGPLTGDFEKLMFMQQQGVGAVVTKTISTVSAIVPRPCILGGRDYIMNCELWSEYEKEKWINDFLPRFKEKSTSPLIISVGYSKEDMEILIPLLDKFADAFEVSTHYVGTDLSIISETVKTIRKHTKKPFYMKISPHINEPVLFAQTIKEAGATGIAAINSLGPTMKIDIKNQTIIHGNEKGFAWTSGPVIKNLALATVYLIKKAMPDFTVIGVGGIQSADDVIEFLLAGASGVQMLSGALLKGKTLYSKIIKDLPKALEKYGFNSIEEVRKTYLTVETSHKPKLPQLDEEKCTECLLCEKICPYFAIEFKDKITFDKNLCFGCDLCITKCPVGAIY